MVLETSSQELTSNKEDRCIFTSETIEDAAIKSIDDCLEVVVAWIEKTAGKTYFMAPLEDFQAQYGKVNHDDDYYQTRMNYFLEHCVLERPMSGSFSGRTPLSIFLEKNPQMTFQDSPSAVLWRNFCGFRHGVFQVVKAGSNQIVINDLLADRKLSIGSKSGETLRYFPRKSIFQGFIFGQGDHYVLGQGLIIHPEMANSQILKFIKNHKIYPRFAASELARFLAQTNMRYLRMQHVNPDAIYATISPSVK